MNKKFRKLIALLLSAGVLSTLSFAGDDETAKTDCAFETIVKYLVDSKLYNNQNAEIFIKTLTDEEIEDLCTIISDEKLQETVNAVAPTRAKGE